MTRDVQKQRLYDAEGSFRHLVQSGLNTVEIFSSTLTMPQERIFGSLSAVENYLAWIEQQSWYRLHYGKSVPAVRRRKGRTRGHYEPLTETIALPEERYGRSHTMAESYVLHELAHHLARGDGHGPVFAGVFQHLVREAMGPEAGLMLASAFEAGGVKWTYVMEKEGAA